MNHGFKINGNILEITLPEEVHIDKVIVNRKMFSQRQRVCESCKYHEKEGHEEPCVSCEVGNSNYVPSVGLEEPTEERTETHACDCVSRQAAIDVAKQHWYKPDIAKALEELPSAQPEIKPISYQDCSNAMLKMWIDNVLTDGEYNRIMEKLNSKHMTDMRGEQECMP